MKQIGKRILSMLLVFAMAFSLLPAAARAAVGPPEAETTAWFTGKIGELNDSLPAGEAKFPETFSWFALEDTDLYWGAASRQVIGPTGAVSDMIVFLAPGAEFGGSDDAGSRMVEEIQGEAYEPWFTPVLETLLGGELPGEIESLLFCIQTGVGVGVLAYGFGYFVARKKYSAQSVE